MTRVDFYLLSEQTEQARWLFACRLCAKAYQKKHKIYIHMASETAAQEMDQLLWSYSEESFVPHSVIPSEVRDLHPKIRSQSRRSLVTLGMTTEPPDVLINLTPTVPDFFNQFARIIEIIPKEPTQIEQGRKHFRFYREQGCQLESHKQ